MLIRRCKCPSLLKCCILTAKEERRIPRFLFTLAYDDSKKHEDHLNMYSLKCRKRPINALNTRQQRTTFMTLPGSGPKHKDYNERRIMGFSMDQMYQVVSDVEKYQEFLPWCQKSLVKIRRKGHVVADLEVGFPPLIESYTSSVTLVKPHLIRAESTQGKLFNQLITTWKFSPGLKGKPQTCVVDFHVSFEFRSAITSQLANAFFNEVVRAMAGAFYNEAKKRYGRESVPSRKINIVTNAVDDERS